MTPHADLRHGFFQECEELLEALAEGLTTLRAGVEAGVQTAAQDPETVNAVFRAVHSIKGGAGAFALAGLVAFAHRFETALDGMRAGRVAIDAPALRTLLRAADHLADQVDAAARGDAVAPAATAEVAALLDALAAGPSTGASTGASTGGEAATSWGLFGDDDLFAPVPIDLSDAIGDAAEEPAADRGAAASPEGVAAETAGGPALRLRFAPHAALYDNGHDPALLLKALADLGTTRVTADLAALPRFEDHDPRQPALAWDVTLWTDEGETAVQEVFEFVHGLCDLDVRPASPLRLALTALRSERARERARDDPRPSGTARGPVARPAVPDLGLVERPPAAATAAEPMVAEAAPPGGVPLDGAPLDGAPLRPLAGMPTAEQAAEARGPRPTLRVDLERVDRLVDGVGELIVNQAMIAQALADRGLGPDDALVARAEDYRLLARDVQEAVMALRAQAVKPLFQRLSRTLRDALEATGKQAVLVTAGESTEVDKTLIERLADPLTHLVRNAVDHGIEAPEARAARGKPAHGTIRLAAAHRSGTVVISVSDDGAGLDRDRIVARARARGLLAPDAEPTEAEAHALLFVPGFSTVDAVSALSGRGVGLDVVRTAVTALGGRVAVASMPGRGTEFAIQLPLTLAVMDGMIVSVAGQTMVIPLTAVLETVRPAPGDLHRLGRAERVLRVRGRLIPVIDLACALGFAPAADEGPTAGAEAEAAPLLLLVEAEDLSQWALVVEGVHDQRQVVIKGLDANFGPVAGVSAATVLGDGRIALILDPDALTRRARAERAALPAPQPREPLHAHA